ncbi:MAG: tryptophan--tRNA ligase [Nanoarchaeota archaeon]
MSEQEPNQKYREMSEVDYRLKCDLRVKEQKYYLGKIQDSGLKPMERFLAYCPNPSLNMKRGVTFAHMDLEGIAGAISEGKPWAVVSGLNPSGPLHFGHKVIFDELLWMQQQGADVFIPLTNDESYVVGKSKSLAESRRIAYDDVIPSIIAMGFDSNKTKIFVDSDYADIYNVAMDLSKYVTLNKVFKVFGLDKEDDEIDRNPGTLFYRAAVQVAQILLPQYPEFGGPKPTIVPVGIDQHPYILLARDMAEKKGFIPPSELVMKFLFGMDGKGKMSASRPGSAVFLTDSPEKAEKTIKASYTGGVTLRDFQIAHGGIPEICPVGCLREWHFENDRHVSERCSSGKLLCGDDKRETIEMVKNYLRDHQEKREEARKRIDKFILKTPIRSIFEE